MSHETLENLLHEERYLGNASLHELTTPSARDIEDGLGIIEGLINTIYILPSKAKRLKDRREAKGKPDELPTLPAPSPPAVCRVCGATICVHQARCLACQRKWR